MMSAWVESLEHHLHGALDLLSAAVRDCPGELWTTPMWQVADPATGHPAASQRWSQPWAIAWHALEVFDYDLSGELHPWSPPPPFAAHPHWRDLAALSQPWSAAQLLGYIEHCKGRLTGELAGMTEASAATPLPAAHRNAGQPRIRVIEALIGHTTEHATQIRQFAATSPAIDAPSG